MNDKEMIEEMARILKGYCCLISGTPTKGDCYQCKKSFASCFDYAKHIYEQGYRKIDKDSVVLSREEYEKLQEKLVELRLDKQDLKNEISEKNNKIALLEETIECIKFNVDFTRKETAEKILNNLLKEIYKRKSCGNADVVIYELAKQFGVEIKE